MQPLWSAAGSEAPRRFRPATPRGSRNPAHILKSGVAASLCHRTPNERTVPKSVRHFSRRPARRGVARPAGCCLQQSVAGLWMVQGVAQLGGDFGQRLYCL